MAWSAPSGDDARVYMPQYPEQSVSVGYPEHATGEAPHLYDESENSFFAVEMESTQSYVAVGTDSQTNDGSPPKIYGSEFATPNNNEGFSGIQDLMTASPLNAVSDAGNMQIMANEGCQHNPGHRLSINVTDYDHEQREFIDLGEAPQVLAENSAGYGMWSGGGPYHPCNADIVGNGHNNMPVPNDMPVHWENSTNRDMGRGPWNPVAASHGSYSANDPSLIGVSGSSSHWSGHGGYSSTSNAPETWPSSASNGPSNPGAMESMMPTTPWDLSKFNGGGRRESHVSSNSLSPVGSPFRGYDNASMTSPGNGYRGAGDTPSGSLYDEVFDQEHMSDFQGPHSEISSLVSETSSQLPDELHCPYNACDKKYTGTYRRGTLQRHLRLKHGPVEEKGYVCESVGCGKVFKRQDARLKHHRRRHPELQEADPKSRGRRQPS